MAIASFFSSHLSRQLLTFAGLLALTLATAACGDSEPDQRKAFIKFLDDINHRVGVHFLVRTHASPSATTCGITP